MSNIFRPAQVEIWSKVVQRKFYANLIAKKVARMTISSEIKNLGDTVNRVAYSDPVVGNVAADGSYFISPITTESEQIKIDTHRSAATRVTKRQRKQVDNKYIALQGGLQGARLAEDVDREFFAELINALNETAPFAYAPGTRVNEIVNEAIRQLSAGEVIDSSMPLDYIVDPFVFESISNYVTNTGNDRGQSHIHGEGSKSITEFRLAHPMVKGYVSNTTLPFTAQFVFAANPADGETVSINGATFTFKTALSAGPTVKGEVLIGATTADTLNNLVMLLGNPQGFVDADTGLAFDPTLATAFGAPDLVRQADGSINRASRYLVGVSATVNTTGANPVLDVFSKRGRVSLGHALATVGSGFQNATLWTFLMERGAADLAIQSQMQSQTKDVTGKLAEDMVTDVLFQPKLFTDGADRTVRIPVITQADAIN